MNQADTQKQSATPAPRASGGASSQSGGSSKKSQMVAGATSFAEGEARLSPVQLKTDGSAPAEIGADGKVPGALDGKDGATPKAPDAPTADGKDGATAKDDKKADPFADEKAKLEAAGRDALAKLPQTSAADAAKTPGNVGQGTVEQGELPDWFMEIQNRLVASTTWGEAEENAQHVIRDYAMIIAKSHAGPDGKIPGHLKVFFDYIGRGSKNDKAATKAGYKGTSALTGAEGAKNWCAGAASSAQRIAQKEGRDGVLADLKSRGLEPSTMPTIFFSNLSNMSGSAKTKMFYNDTAFAEPLEPGDRVDYLFDNCQYGGHAVHIVADLGESFLHVSGNTTRHSAVATGQAKRLKEKPAGLSMGIANNVSSDESKKKASDHIRGVSFGGGKLVYMIQRHSTPYKALEMLETDDPKALETALKKLLLKRTAAAPAPAAAKDAGSGGGDGKGAPAAP